MPFSNSFITGKFHACIPRRWHLLQSIATSSISSQHHDAPPVSFAFFLQQGIFIFPSAHLILSLIIFRLFATRFIPWRISTLLLLVCDMQRTKLMYTQTPLFLGLRVGQINQTTTNIDKRLTASDWNLSIRSQNSIVVRDNMTIHPLYNMATGNIVVGCPTTTAEINRMTSKFLYYTTGCIQMVNIIWLAVRINVILRQLDIIPTRSLNMKRRQLKQVFRVVVHVL